MCGQHTNRCVHKLRQSGSLTVSLTITPQNDIKQAEEFLRQAADQPSYGLTVLKVRLYLTLEPLLPQPSSPLGGVRCAISPEHAVGHAAPGGRGGAGGGAAGGVGELQESRQGALEGAASG